METRPVGPSSALFLDASRLEHATYGNGVETRTGEYVEALIALMNGRSHRSDLTTYGPVLDCLARDDFGEALVSAARDILAFHLRRLRRPGLISILAFEPWATIPFAVGVGRPWAERQVARVNKLLEHVESLRMSRAEDRLFGVLSAAHAYRAIYESIRAWPLPREMAEDLEAAASWNDTISARTGPAIANAVEQFTSCSNAASALDGPLRRWIDVCRRAAEEMRMRPSSPASVTR
jgi:hypothetical protein